MAKIGDFSFCGNLPTYKPTRHWSGIVSNSQLYLFFTLLTVLQIVLSIFLYFSDGNQEKFREAVGAAPEVAHAVVGGVVLIWVVTIVFSLIGYCEHIPYLHFPLAFIEIPFFLISIGGTAVFCWKISLKGGGVDERLSQLYIAIVCFLLALFHVYYTWILFFLWKDGRNKRRIDEFIARQRMIDDVYLTFSV
ncbi:hypothetical protein CRE_10612 [Caenorhabditis remanei]|uniref:MARVEL domain-containing protein n=1 Tax=Caenorhabditis remanei TaxID=31234 RepID=E3NBI8_CAERE|nr:hypothetical protein CRE_10612 [Caenorhabditis remanei]